MHPIIERLIGTFSGLNNEGSAKRATAFWVFVVLITSVVSIYVHAVYVSVHQSTPTVVDIKVLDIFMQFFWSLLITGLILLGLTSVEFIVKSITDLIAIIRGNNPTKKEDKDAS